MSMYQAALLNVLIAEQKEFKNSQILQAVT